MPEWADFFSRLAGFSRLILFDKRGLITCPFMNAILSIE